MSKSPLVEYEHISPFRNSPRNQPITKVTWHHCAGVLSLEQFDAIVHKPGRNMSSNYCVDKDARVGLFCPEEDRCWCSSSSWNDNRAVVLEISNSRTGGDWPISKKVYDKCIELTVDICKRNGIKKLTYTGDKNGSLTFHRFFAATGCLPIDETEVLTRHGWMFLRDVKIGDEIATVNPDDLSMNFDYVQNLVPVKKHRVYTQYGMTVTSDHRVLYNDPDNGNTFEKFENLHKPYVIPTAAISHREGLDMTSSEMVFLLEMLRIGKINDEGSLDFRYVVESKKEWFQGLLSNIGFKYTRVMEDLGPVRFTIDDERALELVDRYLVDGRELNWRWLDMNPTQFSYFIYKITSHVNRKWDRMYLSSSITNIDIVQAICALNSRGTRYDAEKKVLYVSEPYRKMDGSHIIYITEDVDVSCVTVESGAFIIRQHGYVTVTGNCPGEYIFSRAQEICDLVNAQLEEKPEPTPEPTPTVDVGVGDLVSIANGATYYTGKSIPAWVIKNKWYIDSVSGDRAILGKNEDGSSNIQSPISTKFLTVVKKATTPTPTPEPVTNLPYTTKLTSGTVIYKIANGKVTASGKVSVTSVYTITQETTVGSTKYGYLKSGAGWVKLSGASPVDNTIKVGDYVKVLNGVTYDGKKFVIYEKKYKVLQVNGDRIVISADGKNVTAAVKASNCQKV